MHEGQESFRIDTPNATYYYHRFGAGFASIEDTDGRDWLGYRPGGGSAGEYRGIPNMGYPEGYCHPGKNESDSVLLSCGPVRVSIRSASRDGNWACRWDIFPRFARMTVMKTSHLYWFLYEGTPGGRLDPDTDFCIRPGAGGGIRTPASESWVGDLASHVGFGEWVCFGDGGMVLYLAHHEDDGEIDSYYPMNGEMTVFGFGRKKLEKYMTRLPARFTLGFCGSDDYDVISGRVASSYMPVVVTVRSLDGGVHHE